MLSYNYYWYVVSEVVVRVIFYENQNRNLDFYYNNKRINGH